MKDVLSYLQHCGRVMVFIDAANLENSVKDLGWYVDYIELEHFFRERVGLSGIYFYCPRFNTVSQDRFFTILKKNGYTLITKPLKIIQSYVFATGHTRKANFDVELSLDAITLRDRYDTIILFSGDSDFQTLLERLRRHGKLSVVISSRGHVSWELAQSADRYIPLDTVKPFIMRNKKSPRTNTGEVDDS